MTASLRIEPPTMTAEATPRWWESAREGRIFCGPEGDGHHIPARFEIPESGFVQCSAPGLSQELLDLKRYRELRRSADAERVERNLRRRGEAVPDLQTLRAMVRDAAPCDRWVFVYAIRGGGVITARVHPDERRAMRALSTPAEMIEYLQILPSR